MTSQTSSSRKTSILLPVLLVLMCLAVPAAVILVIAQLYFWAAVLGIGYIVTSIVLMVFGKRLGLVSDEAS